MVICLLPEWIIELDNQTIHKQSIKMCIQLPLM